jgi:magnesium-transporting ATPase (P-type)
MTTTVNEINKEIHNLKDKRANLQWEERKVFFKDNKAIFNIMDWLIFIMILSNVGAMVITNALVSKTTPEIKFVEVNPIQAELSGFEGTGHTFWHNMGILFRSLFFYGILVASYIFTRFKISTKSELYWYLAVYSGVAVILFIDFANDLGYLLGLI